MPNATYLMLGRQQIALRELEKIAHNVANVNTTGFHQDHLWITSWEGGRDPHGPVQFASDQGVIRDLQPAPLQHTKRPFDVAIQGEGYLALETPQGIRYTRAGNFRLNPQGVLVSLEGYPVPSAEGTVMTLQPTDTEVTIRDDGTLQVRTPNTGEGPPERRGSIGMFSFQNPRLLERLGNRLYRATEEPTPDTATNTMVQGMLEGSNVNSVLGMTELVEVTRTHGGIVGVLNLKYGLDTTILETLSDIRA